MYSDDPAFERRVFGAQCPTIPAESTLHLRKRSLPVRVLYLIGCQRGFKCLYRCAECTFPGFHRPVVRSCTLNRLLRDLCGYVRDVVQFDPQAVKRNTRLKLTRLLQRR